MLLLAASVGAVCPAVSGFVQQFRLKGKVRRLETRLAVLTRELDAPFCEPTRLEQVVPPDFRAAWQGSPARIQLASHFSRQLTKKSRVD